MKYFGRFTGKRVRLLAAAALLLLAAGVYVGPQIAAAIETGGKRPGETDPFASGKTLLKGDDLIMVRATNTGTDGGDGEKHAAYVSAISPDASVTGDKKVSYYNGEYNGLCLDGGLDDANGFYSTYGTLRLRGDETSYVLQAGPIEGNIRLFAYKADKLAVNEMSTASRRKLNYKLADHANSPRAIGLYSGRWTTSDTRDIVAASVSRVSDKLYFDVSRLRDIQADAFGMLTAASGDVHTRFEFAAARSLDKLVVECAAGDADGDGIQELAFLSDENTDGYYRLRLYKVSGDQFVQAAEIKTELAYHDTPNTKKRIGISFGDVKGEGRDQILVCGYARDKSTYDSGKWGLHWRLYEYAGGKLTAMKYAAPYINNTDKDYTQLQFCKGILADIYGDGKADIVLAYTEPNKYGYGSLMLAAASYVGERTEFSKQRILYGHEADDHGNTVQIGAMDVAAGNFFLEGDPKSLNGNKMRISLTYGDIYYRDATLPTPLSRSTNRLTTGIFDWDAKGKTFSRREYVASEKMYDYNKIVNPNFKIYQMFHITNTSDPLQLLTDDFTKRSLVLGRPYHYVKENENTTMVVMQEPPKHVDYTLVSGTNYGVVNISRVSSFFTNFFQSDTKSSGVSTSQTNEGAMAVTMGATIKGGHKTKVKGVGASDVNVTVEANAKKSWENKDTALKKSFEDTKNSITASTTGDDYVAYSLSTTDIWRYPIIGKFSVVSKDEQLYYTVTVPSPQKAVNKTGVQAIDFQPPWCNGNILSYPRTEAAVLDFIEARRIGGAAEFTVDRNAVKKDVSWSKSISSEKTHTSAISKHGDVTVTVGLMVEVMGNYVDSKFKAGVARDEKNMNTSTATTSFSTSTGFSVVIPSTFPDALNNSNVYSITPIVYESPAKAMKVAYLAKISDANLDWWTQRYAGKPDPALNLPRLWKTSGSSWVIDTDTTTNPNARMIRGFFIANYENLRVGPGIETNKPISLYCRVHNFAMKYKGEDDGTAQGTAKNVNVRFEYQKKELGKLVGGRTQIAETTIDQIPVWNTDNLTDYNNKLAAVSWDVTAVPDGHYRVFVTVNPDKSIDELPYHGIGEACDNNEGWYDVCIAAPKEPKQASALIEAGELDAEVAGDTSADDPWFFGIGEVDLCDTDNDFTYTLDQDGIKVATEITNKGTNAALNVLVSLIDKDENVVDVQRFPGVLPGETVGVELAGELAENYTGDLKFVIGEVIGETNMDSNSVTKTIGGSGSGGCSAGFGALALLAIAVLPAAARRKR